MWNRPAIPDERAILFADDSRHQEQTEELLLG